MCGRVERVRNVCFHHIFLILGFLMMFCPWQYKIKLKTEVTFSALKNIGKCPSGFCLVMQNK